MTRFSMHGCNGHMGQVITGIVAQDPDAEIVAGIDLVDNRDNGYPVFTNIWDCDVEADALIDFASPKATDTLLEYCVAKKLPVVLCTTGLSGEQLDKIREASKEVAVLKSANMSLGINTLLSLLQDAAKVLAPAGFDMEIVEKHHRLKLDAPSGTAIALADSMNEALGNEYHQSVASQSALRLDGRLNVSNVLGEVRVQVAVVWLVGPCRPRHKKQKRFLSRLWRFRIVTVMTCSQHPYNHECQIYAEKTLHSLSFFEFCN